MPWAKENEADMLMLLSEIDQTVPHEHSLRLFAAWKGAKRHQIIQGTDHSDIVRHSDFFPIIAAFFGKSLGPKGVSLAGDESVDVSSLIALGKASKQV
jgi:hypothetical protein